MSESKFFEEYLKYANFLSNNEDPVVSHRIETRTRQYDVTDALRFRVHDPLWMLSRQWQMGEFRGNDAGTALGVYARVRMTPIDQYQIGKDGERVVVASADTPLEPTVEQVDREITPMVRVESALYFLDLLDAADKYCSADREKLRTILMDNKELVLEEKDLSMPRCSIDDSTVAEFTASRNTRLNRFKASCAGKIFDGYKLYGLLGQRNAFFQSRGNESGNTMIELLESLATDYRKWFQNRYCPNSKGKSAWDTQSLGYQFKAENAYGVYTADNYPGGRVSWYSFDLKNTQSKRAPNAKIEEIVSIPTLASYPGSPNKRLWQFEDRKVFMGNSTDMQSKGNIAFLQYATMYGNDWMLFPLKTEIGKYVEVVSIGVYDSFGMWSQIVKRAGKDDKGAKTFGQKWQMFTCAPINPESTSAESAAGLLFPPSMIRTLEGEAIEEVNILRDEMANMVWGVETRLDDGCGSHIDANLLASEVGQYVDESYVKEVEKAQLSVRIDKDGNAVAKSSRDVDFKYTLMTGVPFNWIPFVPQHTKTKQEKVLYKDFLGGREVAFRRGKMPCYFVREKQKGAYYPVRPLSSILHVETCTRPDKTVGEVPLFIDEEQIQGVGTLIVKNCQRSRWIGGKTYTWMGYSKQVKNTQGVSGLEYDTLKDASEK